MRAKNIINYGQDLYDDVVHLVKQLEALPPDEPCLLETVVANGDEA
jgi:hypothetical protein